MKKSGILLGGALLLASLFTTSCNEVMSSLDNPVSSYLEVNVAEVTIPTGDSFELRTETINPDNPVTFTSSDESVVSVDANGVITGVADGEATITVSVAASANYQEGTKEVKVAVKRPLTFEALEDGTISVWFHGAVLEKPIIYTKNDGAKQEISTDYTIDVVTGDKIEFQSANERLTQYDWNWGLQIHPHQKTAVYGNVMSMITPDGNYHTNKTITQDFALYGLLCGTYYWDEPTEKFVFFTVPHDKYKLLLPATTLTQGCYARMLQETGFTEAPELPATELANYCYQQMFNQCRNLEKAPAQPAMELKEGCYGYMFESCSALKESPALPATKLENYCYQGMFIDCDALTESPALNVETVGEQACDRMFSYCDQLSKANAITVKQSTEAYAFYLMFSNCPKLEASPAITAKSLGNYACQYMFANSQNLKKANAINVKTVGRHAFRSLFSGKPELTEAVAVNAETLGDYACSSMFSYCPKLTKVPATLPATTLAGSCYSDMFAGCTALEKAPALPAENLADYCYNYMFGGCTSLTEAPTLAAKVLKWGCYNSMFNSCSKLSQVTCLATTNAVDALGQWLADAGTDPSVTTRTLTRAAENTSWEQHNQWNWNWGTDAKWYVPDNTYGNEWTISPAIE